MALRSCSGSYGRFSLLGLLSLLACGISDTVTAPLVEGDPLGAETPAPPVITVLAVTEIAPDWATVEWATNLPAVGLVEYGTTVDYGSSFGVGEPADTAYEVVLRGLVPETTYHVRVTARDSSGTSSTSRKGRFKTRPPDDTTSVPGDTLPDDPPPDEPGSVLGIWMGTSELEQLATTGTGWNNVLSAANGSCGVVDLSDQEQTTNVCVMAKALVFARTGDVAQRADVVTAITQIVNAGVYEGRALALGRELGAYVIAADLIDLKGFDAALDGRFRATLVTLRTTYTTGAATSLVDCHEKRPNNWGAHCGATRAAIAVYLGDTVDLARTAQVFKGYLGDRASYAGFRYGGPIGQEDLSWQCDPAKPVGINPAGCVRDGLSLDGVLPDDQRRGGSFTTSPPKESYVWEALQGLLAQAVILDRAGYPVWDWQDRALLRAVRWLHDVVDYPAEGDDTWQPHLINYYYGASFPAPLPTRAGKNVGWTDWTHGN